MKIGDIIAFRKDLYFEGAVQADWFYSPEKAAKVSENFVFHGKDYYGVEAKSKAKTIDTISLIRKPEQIVDLLKENGCRLWYWKISFGGNVGTVVFWF